MDIFRKNYLDDLIAIKSIISVWRFVMKGKSNPVPDIHDFWEIVFVEEGTYRVIVDGELFEIGCGEAFLYPPLAHHIGNGQFFDATIRIISFESDSADLYKISREPLKLSKKAKELFFGANEIGLGSFFFPENESDIRGMKLCEGADRYALQRMKKSLELFFIDIIYAYDKGNAAPKNTENFKKERYAALNEYLRMNIGKKLLLSDISTALSISVSTLKKLSFEAFGISPLAYFITLKLDAAKRMIKETSFNFTEISEKLGFSGVHYFSRLFKKHVGMTPSEYAKTADF